MTFTKERLTELSRRENVGAIIGEEIAELARIALASLEAEAVCVIDQSNLDYLKSGSDADVWPASRAEMGDVLLYRSATPAPVSVPDEVTAEDCPAFVKYDVTDVDEAWARGFNACRAAMLQGAEPVHEKVLRVQMESIIADLNLPKNASLIDISNEIYRLHGDAGNSPAHFRCRPAQSSLSPAQGGNSPAIPDAYDIKSFGVFHATEGSDGLVLQMDQFRFESGSIPKTKNESMVPKFALQAIINRLQVECDGMGEKSLIDIQASSAAPQQEVKS
ncbi:hypothetical protein RZ769_16260 [Enterobacter kobei]|uniref:hypothetical protein n=1 Tax=Enterobacter kobei TaxID=208224 RepID=UPI0029536403|nr:hypothetical protein [Enterobacter kobei]MDV7019469.1 hypothetical protein [Enterobacter kobei]